MVRANKTAMWVLAGALQAATAWAGCELPVEPAVLPDPAKATDAEMVSAQQTVKQYLGGMESRLKCLEAAKDTDKYNDSVVQMQKVASKFNSVVRAYRARQAG